MDGKLELNQREKGGSSSLKGKVEIPSLFISRRWIPGFGIHFVFGPSSLAIVRVLVI